MEEINVKSEYKAMPIDKLETGQFQARVRLLDKNVDELALSISRTGLIQPIVICPNDSGGLDVIAGQRRLLAHIQLVKEGNNKFKKIMCRVFEKPLTEVQQIAISYAENLVRDDMVTEDHKDVCVDLYYRYGTYKAVETATGIPARYVSKYVKMEALPDELKELVRKKTVSLNAADRACQAVRAYKGIEVLEKKEDITEAIETAKRLSPKSNTEQTGVVNTAIANPGKNIDEIFEEAESKKEDRQLVFSMSAGMEGKLTEYSDAKEETKEESIYTFVSEGLANAGFGLED